MKHKFIILILMLVNPYIMVSQVSINWTHFLEQRSKPALGSEPFAVSSSGNVFVPYAHKYPGIFNNTASIVSLRSADGAQLNKYDLPQTLASFGDYPAGFVMDGANNIYTGFTYNYDDNYDFEDGRLFKHNAMLVPQWDRYIYATTPPGYDFSIDLAFSPGSLFWLAQRADSGFCVTKYSTNGTLLWKKLITKTPSFIRTDASGNFYLLGSIGNSLNGQDIYVSKYTATGLFLWENYISAAMGMFTDNFSDFTTDAAGNVYVTGSSQRFSTGRDIITVKLNSDGILQWSRLITGSGNHNDFGKAITVDNAGNVYVAGSIYESNNGIFSDNIILRKYNSVGTVLATRKYNHATGINDSPSDIKVTNANKIYVVGKTGVSYLFQQYSTSLGPSEFTDFYTPDTASLIAGLERMEAKGDHLIIRNNKAYVLGEFFYEANCCADDFYEETFIRKYAIPTAPIRIDDAIAFGSSSIKLFPNPANEVLYIESSMEIKEATIYDLTGRVVLHISEMATGLINISFLKSGLYIIQIATAEGTTAQRFVKN